VYLARTYAYVAAGRQGLAVVDIERAEAPVLDQLYDAGGALNDARDVKVGMTNASLFAYVADGKNGLRVVQLTSPEETPTYLGFSPRPQPRLIATARTRGPALAVSKGTDRDRAVDESGHQIAVFNRLGSRPLTLAEMQRLYLKDGRVYTVAEEPPAEPRKPAPPKREEPATEPETGPRLRRPR
jgi:LVIVD repeat